MAEEGTKKKSGFSGIMQSRIKSARPKLFWEGALGYLIGPALALFSNSVLANYLNRYMSDVLEVNVWASGFFQWYAVISVVIVVLGNILVGRLMDHMHSRAGKARPLLLISIPISIVALIVLFIATPFVGDEPARSSQIWALVWLAIGYNLWFAFAYPMYFTSHGALVNLSTRDSGARGLLATLSNAATLGAVGLTQMIIPFFFQFGFLFVEDEDGTFNRQQSYNTWMIFVVILIVVLVVGALIEFYLTRERVTEEQMQAGEVTEIKKAVPVSKQWKVVWRDKFWWIIIAFYFLYQLGGQLKNVSIQYFSIANFANSEGLYSSDYGSSMSSTLAIIGAIPTVVGMFICWPISNKIGKARTIFIGAALAVVGGVIGFIAPQNFAVVATSVCIKALGSTPAMYLSLALMADVLDHEEAENGFRTDGLTMTIYGAIMAGMTGIATGILNIVLNSTGYSIDVINNAELMGSWQTGLTWVYIGGETICYFVIFLIMLFMVVEKHTKEDHEKIVARQKAEAEAAGIEWIPPEEKLRMEEAESRAAAEAQRIEELKAKCEKKGLNFDEEEAKYQEKKAAQDAAKAAKKAAQDAKKAEAAAKKAEAAAKKNGGTAETNDAASAPEADEANPAEVTEGIAETPAKKAKPNGGGGGGETGVNSGGDATE